MPHSDPFSGRCPPLRLLALATLVPLAAHGQALTQPPPGSNPTPVVSQPVPTPTPTPTPLAAPTPAPPANATAIEQLTQSNRELLDLLKKQQGVLEDMQFDRRLQSRQIENLEVRLTETIQQNGELEAKIAKLQTQLTAPPPSTPANPPPASAPTVNTPPVVPPTPPPPASYLPPAPPESPPGTKAWHRIYTLSGTDGETSDPFHIDGHSWRVVWHNQDKEGDVYKNTSGLFINAFAQGDTIPQKVCARVGTGGDTTELTGPGDYVLKVEASGGSWELAVEDFH